MPKKDYARYSLPDFLDDEFFIQWVTEDDPESRSFWIPFTRGHPEQQSIVTQAFRDYKSSRKTAALYK